MTVVRPLAIVSSLGLAFALACASHEPAAAPSGPPPGLPVKVVTVASEPLEQLTEAVGTIEAVDTVVLMPEMAGVIVHLGFDDGQAVRKGDVLVRLRPDAARAQLADAEARLTLGEARLVRVSALVERGNASRQELDQAVADRDLARAAVDLAREMLRRTEVRAPFDGVVGRRMVSVGAAVTPLTVLGRIESAGVVTIDAALPERAIGDVAVGQVARVRAEAWPEEVFEGTVSFVAPRVDASTRTLPMRARVANPDGRLVPGMTARVAVVTATSGDSVLVPTQAVVPGAAGSSVYVVGAEGKAELRPVRTGTRLEGVIEVEDGLVPGDRVIVEGLVKMSPGAPVRVIGG